MAINFPGSLDNFTNPTSASPINSPSHADQHANANDAIEALEAKVGVDGSSVITSHDYKIAQLQSLVTSAVAGAKSIYQDVRNQSGSAFTKATPVYVSGSTGASGQLLVSAASNATEAASSKTMGITTSAISNNSNGQVISEGILEGIDTTGAADGDPVWLGVNGAKIYGLANKPSAPAHLVFLGIVIRGGQANTGSMYVKIQNGFELHELHNVQVSSLVNGNILAYDSTTQTWKNTNTLQSTSSTTPLVVKGATSQTADLQQWQDSSGNLLGRFHPTAGFLIYGIANINGGSAPYLNTNTTSFDLFTNIATNKGLIIRGAASQTADLQQWQDSSGNILSRIGNNGTFFWGGNSYLSASLGTALIGNNYASDVALKVKAATSQTANLQEWQNSSGTVLTRVNNNGNIIVGNSYISYTDVSAYGRLQIQDIGTNQTTLYPMSAGFLIQNLGVTGMTILKIRGAPGQTANLQEWQDSTGTALASVSATGTIYAYETANSDALNIYQGSGARRLVFGLGGLSTTSTFTSGSISWSGVAQTEINSGTASRVGLLVKGAASQTADLQQWQRDDGFVLLKVSSSGDITAGSGSSTAIRFRYFDGINITGTYWDTVETNSATFIGRSTTATTMVVRGAASQTADLQQWQTSTGSINGKVDNNGTFWIGTSNLINYGYSTFAGNNAGNVPIIIIGAPSQTADLQQWKNSAGTVLSKIASNGRMVISSDTEVSSGMLTISQAATSAIVLSTTSTANDYGLALNATGSGNNTSIGISFSAFASNGYNGVATPGGAIWFTRSGPYSLGYFSFLTRSGGGANDPLKERMRIGDTGTVSISGFTASSQGLIIKAAASQTADLQQWQNSSGTVLTSVFPSGNISIGTTQAGVHGQANSQGVVTTETAPLIVRGSAPGQNMIELWAYGKDAYITGAVGNGTSVTYTTSIAHGFTTSDYVTVNGIIGNPGSGTLNMGGGATVSAVTTYTFTLPNTTTQTYISGGYARNAQYPGNILQAYRSDGMSLFTIGSSGGFAMADVMSVANVGYQQAGISVQPNLPSSAAIRMYGRSAQTAEILDVRNYIYKSGGSDSIFAIIPDYSVSANADGYGAWVRMKNAATPTTNPTSAGYLYVGSGALNYMGTSNVPQQIVGADGSVKFTSPAASIVPLIIQHASSPTSSYFEIRNSAGNPIWGINSAGESLNRTTTKFGANIQNDSNNNNNSLSLSAPSSGGTGIPLYVYSGSTTRDMVKFDNSGVVKLTITSDGSLKGGNSNTISVNTASTVDTVALSSFTSMEYTLSIKQGSKIRSSKVLVHTDGTSVDSTEYGIMEMGGGITGILVTSSVSGTDAILQVTITDATTTNATVKLIKTML